MISSKKHTTKPRPILGYTTRKHLLLDLDDTTVTKAARLVDMIFKEFPEVGDCLIVESSKGSDTIDLKYNNFNEPYHKRHRLGIHLVFDNLIGYNKACHIIAILAGIHILNRGYNDIRQFRGDLTLRTTPKVNLTSVQPQPHPVLYKVNERKTKKDGYIGEYLSFLRACTRVSTPDLDTESGAGDSPKSADYSTQSGAIDTEVESHQFEGSHADDTHDHD